MESLQSALAAASFSALCNTIVAFLVELLEESGWFRLIDSDARTENWPFQGR
jgi:hypothetical protein